MRYILAVVALTGLAACGTLPPASKSGVGFGNYDQYQKEQAQRKVQPTGAAGAALPAPDAVSGETLEPAQPVGQPQTQIQPQSEPETDLAAATQTALNSTPTPDNPGISDENDFDAVGSRRTIESDKERMARIKENYKVIAPQALPKRSGSTGPNIVDYALRSKHPIGTQIYKRANLGGASKYARNCGKFASSDLAQIQFLAKGGPQRDKLGIDPDGDGYACTWDPAPFRKAAGG